MVLLEYLHEFPQTLSSNLLTKHHDKCSVAKASSQSYTTKLARKQLIRYVWLKNVRYNFPLLTTSTSNPQCSTKVRQVTHKNKVRCGHYNNRMRVVSWRGKFGSVTTACFSVCLSKMSLIVG